jgi:hypothetical protein
MEQTATSDNQTAQDLRAGNERADLETQIDEEGEENEGTEK